MSIRAKGVIIALVIATVTVSGVFAAPKVKAYENAAKAPVPAELITYFEDHGLDMTGAENGTLSAETQAAMQEIYTDDDESWNAEINRIALAAVYAERVSSGEPAYLEVGPLYWGVWFEDDPTD